MAKFKVYLNNGSTHTIEALDFSVEGEGMLLLHDFEKEGTELEYVAIFKDWYGVVRADNHVSNKHEDAF